MRYFLVTVLILMFTSAALAEPMATVPKSYLKDVKVKLEKLKAIEDATPTVSIKGLEVVQDSKNRVFIKDTAAVEIKLAMLEYADSISIKGKVKQYFVPNQKPFVTRFGLATVAEQQEFLSTRMNKNAAYLTYKIFGYKKVSLEALANFRRWGVGLAHKITPNTKLIVGVNYRFKEAVTSNSKAFIGVGFNF